MVRLSMQAAASSTQVYVNDSVDLGVDATFEKLMAENERLLDMTGAVPRGGML